MAAKIEVIAAFPTEEGPWVVTRQRKYYTIKVGDTVQQANVSVDVAIKSLVAIIGDKDHALKRLKRADLLLPSDAPYKIYTTKYDTVDRPLDLASPDELKKLAQQFHQLCPVEDFQPLRERLEQLKAPTQPTMVTLLIDNSGSMRGSKITFAVGTAGIIGMYLDRLGIPNEILGFTTRKWKGGDPREEWLTAGKPKHPGRLNALRHIVYKSVDEKLDDVRDNLALMFKEGMLKENIDGEAIEWACDRLRFLGGACRRKLLVISDGAPIDDSTIAANPVVETSGERNILSRHLTKVIQDLKDAGDIELDAIGIQHDVSHYYEVGTQINQLGDLASTAIAKLESLLQGTLVE